MAHSVCTVYDEDDDDDDDDDDDEDDDHNAQLCRNAHSWHICPHNSWERDLAIPAD